MEPGLSSARSGRDAIVLTDSAVRIVAQGGRVRFFRVSERKTLNLLRSVFNHCRNIVFFTVMPRCAAGHISVPVKSSNFIKNNASQTVLKPLSEQWRNMLILLRIVIGFFA